MCRYISVIEELILRKTWKTKKDIERLKQIYENNLDDKYIDVREIFVNEYLCRNYNIYIPNEFLHYICKKEKNLGLLSLSIGILIERLPTKERDSILKIFSIDFK